MTHDQARRIVQELVDAVNEHDVGRIMRMYADDAVTVSPVSGQVSGFEAIQGWWERIFGLFPDWTVSLSDLLVDGDRVAFFGSAAATDREGWFGQQPTGERFEYRAIIVLDFCNGKIVRDERIYDLSSIVERLEKTRLEKEMRMAADVQRVLLPRIERSTAFCDVVADSIPSRAIGGDFFEWMPFAKDEVAIAIGDVSGKGTPAALLGAMLQGMLASEARADVSPSGVVASINSLLSGRHLKSRFCTFVYGVLTSDGRFTYVNAGHNPPLLVGRDGIRRLGSTAPVLGVFEDARFGEETIELRAGETIVFFSDGVTEARDVTEEEFGEQRLIDCVRSTANKPAAAILDAILSSVRDFAVVPADDMTVVVMMYRSAFEEGS